MVTSKTKRCCTCRKLKAFSAFYRLKSSADGRYPNCVDCYKKARAKKIESLRADRRDWERRLHEEAIQVYGGKCRCCGEKRVEFLNVEPIPGKIERATIKGSLPYWLKRNDHPKGFRVFCRNCRGAYERYGYCPHTRAAI